MLEGLSLAGALIVGSVAFRIRGGWQPFGLSLGGTTVNRLFWSAVMTAIGALIAFDWRLTALFPAFFLGILMGWGSYMDLGRMPKPDNESLRALVRLSGLKDGSFWYDFVGLTVRGLALTLLPGLVLGWFAGGWIYVAAGLLMAPAYWLGWKLGGTEQAEFIFGGWLGLALALAAY